MAHQVTAYQCQYCNMVSLYRSSVLRHELESCRKNPNRKCCLNCKHGCYEYEDNPDGTTFKVFACEKDLFGGDFNLSNENNDCDGFEAISKEE